LKIVSGDLLHGDRHGIVNIPLSVAAEVSVEACKIKDEEHELVDFCRSPRFSLRELAERIQDMNLNCDLPWRGGK
jgi:regulator of RNase E activity RraA